MNLELKELEELAGARILFGPESLRAEHVTTDSQKIKGSDLFIPVIGQKTDGHRFISSAFENGAVCAFTQEPERETELEKFCDSRGLLLVDSTVDALQRTAEGFRRKHLSMPFIGVTGSVGKTTTREMICQALRSQRKVTSTKGNANSQVGVPITVMEAEQDADFAVVELGISEPGEMQKISRIPGVELAVMTNIGISHLAQFGTQEKILEEKLQILSGSPEKVCLLVNGDDPILGKLTEEQIHGLGIACDKEICILRYGFGMTNDYRVEEPVRTDGFVTFRYHSARSEEILKLSVPGDHMALNAVAALAVCEHYGLEIESAARALEGFTGYEGRGNRITRDGYTIINDCYNASPVSMKNGLKVLSELRTRGRKIAVLADMKELGPSEEDYHREIGRFIREKIPELSLLFTYGKLAELIGQEAGKNENLCVRSYQELEPLKKNLYEELSPGDLLLLKGSWSMGLGKLI